jgi:hypothetical protein
MVDRVSVATGASGDPCRSPDSSAPRARPAGQAGAAPRAPAGSAVRDFCCSNACR